MLKLPLAVVILAAGKGKRMMSERPKVLHYLGGKPLLRHVLEITYLLDPDKILLVIGHGSSEIRSVFGTEARIEFVEQHEQLGTGHAVMQTRPALDDFDGNILVLCGDMPFIKSTTLENMIQCRMNKRAACVLLTLKTSESKDFGRILRTDEGNVCGVVEQRDANDQQKTIDEYNAGVYCFERSLLFQSVCGLDNLNVQSEYYLTDVVEYFASRNLTVHAVQTRDNREVFGINSVDDLKNAERILAGKQT